MRKVNARTVALVFAVAALAAFGGLVVVADNVPHVRDGAGYGVLVDSRDHCILGISDAALPASVTSTCQAGALLWRTDTSTLYSLASGSFSAWTPTFGATTVGSLTSSGDVAGATATISGAATIGGAASVVGLTNTSTGQFAGTHGETWTCGWGTELVTLATGGTTSDTSANLLPADSIIYTVVGRVTTTITASCTGWELGDSTSAARFTANDTTLTANETKVGITQFNGNVSTTALGPTQASAAKVRITCAGGNPGAGAIRVSVFSCTGVAPTS